MCLKQVQLLEGNSSQLKSTLTKNRKFFIDNVSSVNSFLDFLAHDLGVEEKDDKKSWSALKAQVQKLLEDILVFKVKSPPKVLFCSEIWII